MKYMKYMKYMKQIYIDKYIYIYIYVYIYIYIYIAGVLMLSSSKPSDWYAKILSLLVNVWKYL